MFGTFHLNQDSLTRIQNIERGLRSYLWGTERKVHWRFWESVVNEHVI